MRFLAYVKQKSEGCDYTIGCGQTVWPFEADSWAEAETQLKRVVIGDPWSDDWPGYWDEQCLAKVTLFEVKCFMDMPLEQWYAEGEKMRHAFASEKEEERERALYEHLRQRFEKSGNKSGQT